MTKVQRPRIIRMNRVTADRRRAPVIRLLTGWTVPSLGISPTSSARFARAWLPEHMTRFLGIDAPLLAARVTFCVKWWHRLISLNPRSQSTHACQ